MIFRHLLFFSLIHSILHVLSILYIVFYITSLSITFSNVRVRWDMSVYNFSNYSLVVLKLYTRDLDKQVVSI